MPVDLLQSGGSGGTALTGTGIARNTGACTELSGDVTTSGSNATTLKTPLVVSEVDTITLKIDTTNKDIILSRSAAASLAITGSPTVKGAYLGAQLATPAAPTVTPTLGSASTWSYKIVARDGLGQSIASAAGSTAAGAATLDGTHFNTITWAAVAGAVSYDVYRTVVATAPNTTGKIGNVLADATLSFVDNAIAADGTTPPTISTTGVVACSPAGSAAGDGAYMWAMDVDDQQAGGTNVVISPGGANQVLVFMFMCRRTITIRNSVFMNGTTVVSSTKANFGIYDINKNLLIDTGPYSTAVASQTLTQAIQDRSGSPTAVTLYAGEMYYYAMAATNGTVTGLCNYAWNTNSATVARNKNIVRNAFAANALSGNQLPITLGTLTGVTTRTPVLVLFES